MSQLHPRFLSVECLDSSSTRFGVSGAYVCSRERIVESALVCIKATYTKRTGGN